MEQQTTEQMVEESMATASPTYSPPDTPADVEQMMESPVASASPTYSDLEEWPGDEDAAPNVPSSLAHEPAAPSTTAAPLAASLVEDAMGVVAEMLVTFHGVQQRDWTHRPWDIPVLPGLDIPWHPPFIPGYGSYMNSLGSDPEMAAELAKRPVLHWGYYGNERRYRSVKRGDFDVVNGDFIQGVEGPPLETWPCADRRLFGSLMLMGRGVRSRKEGVIRVWARVQREAEQQRRREVQQEMLRRQEELLARFRAQEWEDACGGFAGWAARQSGADRGEVAYVVWGPVGQACWRLFSLCDIGQGGVGRRGEVAEWVVRRLYGRPGQFEQAIEEDPLIQRAWRHGRLSHAELHLAGPRGRGWTERLGGRAVLTQFVRAWYDWYWDLGHTYHMRRQVLWLWEQEAPRAGRVV